MRRSIKDLVRLTAAHLGAPEPIFESGSLQVPGQEGFADLRPLFPGKEYVGCDMREGPGVDRVEDLERLTLSDGSVGTALVLDTLEHVRDCMAAARELCRVVRPGGMAVVSSVMDFVIHDYPHDYWRFTPEAFNLLMEGFPVRLIGSQGPHLQPHTVFGGGLKRDGPPDLNLEIFPRDLQAAMRERESLGRRVRRTIAGYIVPKRLRRQVLPTRNEFLLRLYVGPDLQEEVILRESGGRA